MKARKVLKRIAKIEALISEVTERSSASAPHIRELLGDAKAAVIRAKEAVSSQASHKAKNPPVRRSEPTSKVTPESSKPKRKLSAAGRKAIVAATKKRWATFHAAKQAEKPEPAVPKKARPKKTARKKTAAKTAPAKATKNTVEKAAANVAVQKAAPKKSAPAKTKAPVKKAAKKSAPVTAQPKATAESAPTPEAVAQ